MKVNILDAEQNKFSPLWEAREASFALPKRLRNVQYINYIDFEREVTEQNDDFVKNIVDDLFAGDVFIIKKAFSDEFVATLKRRTHEFWSSRPSEFHKMIEGVPDFHRIIDEEVGKKYSFQAVKHSAYFFPWNSDPLGLFAPINERWRLLKFMTGFKADQYERNTPKDLIVDRIQIVRYPPGLGFLETHCDPHLNQRIFISGYLSKRGVDYNSGGFYVVDSCGRAVYLEDQIDVGDIGIGYATVAHGVGLIDEGQKSDWKNTTDGRWFLGLYSNTSDEVNDRHTAQAVKI